MVQVEEEVARLVAEGYYVVARSEQFVELERKNSWLGVIIGALISFGGPQPCGQSASTSRSMRPAKPPSASTPHTRKTDQRFLYRVAESSDVLGVAVAVTTATGVAVLNEVSPLPEPPSNPSRSRIAAFSSADSNPATVSMNARRS